VTRFLALRLLHGVGIVFLVATLTFVLVRLAPGDPFSRMVEGSPASPQYVEQARRNAGLDLPIHRQYVRYIAQLGRGDLGISFSQRRPVWDALAERIPATLALAFAALLIDFALGILTGAVQGARPYSTIDKLLSGATLTLYSVPVFWLGVVLMLVFAMILGWFPVEGSKSAVGYEQLSLMGQLGDRLHHLALPAITLGLVGAAGTARYQRAAMFDVIRQDFIRSARARGLGEKAVVLRHALRNSLLPIITLFGLSFPILLSGSALVETVFGWPGIGRFTVEAVWNRDYHVVTGAAIISATMVVLGNMLADVLYWIVDPRTRPEKPA
jgi:peptide/nickel transport system permease protein